VNFWDSSAIVPLILDEPKSSHAKELYARDPHMIVWTLSPLEVLSAILRRYRNNELDTQSSNLAHDRLSMLFEHVNVVRAIEQVKRRAERVLNLHPLRAADALQLAAALVSTYDDPQKRLFITFDDRLSLAAQKEGFQVF